MEKPIIGIAPQYDYEKNRIFVVQNYLNSIKLAGGIPVILPLNIERRELETIVELLDGVLFPGGPDIDPFTFGEETHENCGLVLPERDLLEESLFHLAYKRQKPILGICRGIQVLNVFLGGSLYQDLSEFKPYYHVNFDNLSTATPISHYQKSENHVLSHSILIEDNTLLSKITNQREIRVNSFHHQGIKELAPSLIVSARSKDFLVEAIEHPDYKFFLGVQWHPEHLSSFDKHAYNLFHGFIEACR